MDWQLFCLVFITSYFCIPQADAQTTIKTPSSWSADDKKPIYNRMRHSFQDGLKRYTRAYSLSTRFGSAGYYHRLYFYVARLKGFYSNSGYRITRECGNFETNEYHDYIGYFSCPLFFEPSSLKYCCGIRFSHYCCSNKTKATPITIPPSYEEERGIKKEEDKLSVIPIVAGVVVFFFVTAISVGSVIVVILIRKRRMRRLAELAQARPQTNMTVSYAPAPGPTHAYSSPPGTYPQQAAYPQQTYPQQTAFPQQVDSSPAQPGPPQPKF